MLWIPPLGWEVGYFFWGWVIDRAVRRRAFGPGLLRRLFGILALLSLPLATAPLVHALPLLLALLFFAMFVAAGFVIASLAETTRRHSLAHSAYIAGLGAGSWSGAMAILMPIFGRLFDRGAYQVAYAIAAAAPTLGSLLWWALARAGGNADSDRSSARPSPA